MLAVALLALAMLGTPVKAAPATKIEGVTLTYTWYEFFDGEWWVVDHNILQMRGNRFNYGIILSIPGLGDLEGTGSTFASGWLKFSPEIVDPLPAPDPDAVSNQQVKATWAFTGEGTTGTFEGVGHRTSIGHPLTSYQEQRMVLRGTGDFRGQTLVYSLAGGMPPVVEAYILIPN